MVACPPGMIKNSCSYLVIS